ncbi:hypothetical protein D9Q98_009851 [Chlorella vulgaris]|uniref:F-box domain-containing protein n=1 Tax=Chlorella vulgaris TaxID=3077 RepID=A0A9D4TFM2_CHLVU|nr:hypothetical protein D9Q98_009851 [Chlorella vulgaris]
MAPTARRPSKRRAVGLLGIRQANSSDDEDYAPAGYRSPAGASRPASAAAYPPSPVADEDVPLAQRRRQLHAQQQQQQQQQPKPAAAAGSGSGGTPPARTPGLPDEVLCLILRKACDPANGGAIPTAAAATCVCRAWRAAALSSPNLWQHVDLTWPRCRPTDAALARITPRWSGLCSLKLAPGAAGTGGMSGASLQLVAARCPVLTSLSLAHCSQFGEAALCAALTEMLLRPAAADRSSAPLTHLDLSFSEIAPKVSGLDTVVRTVLAQQARNGSGPVLQELLVEGCPVLSHRGLRAVTEASVEQGTPLLAALQVLDLSQSASAKPGFVINLERLQYSAPGLRQLRLNSLCGAYGWSTNPTPSRLPRDAPPPGFCHLRVCQVAAKPRQSMSGLGTIGSYVTDACLIRLLAHASQLEELDVSCCDRLSPDSLATSIHPEAPLKHALLARSGWCCDEAVEFLVDRFGASLEAVDLGWGASRITDAAAAALARCPRLHSVGLEGTAVSSEGVRQLLQAADMHAAEAACSAGGSSSNSSGSGRPVFTVDVGSCRGLERGVRQAAMLGMDQLREALIS